jgi:MFS superfamily sulfate permease-like transporter
MYAALNYRFILRVQGGQFPFSFVQAHISPPLQDFLVLCVTSAATLLFGVDTGILVGVGVSMCALLLESSYPPLKVLGESI